MTKKTKNILRWIFSIFCFTAVLAYGFHICSVIFCGVGALAMPLPKIGAIWEKLMGGKGKWLKSLIIGGLFFAGIMLAPTSENVDPNVNVLATETEMVSVVNTEEETAETKIVVLETEEVASESAVELYESEEAPETENVTELENTEIEVEAVAFEVPNTEVMETEAVDTVVVNNATLNETTSDSVISDENNNAESITEPELKYAVNNKNGKIHIIGECAATGTGKSAMKEPVYFATYEEALAYSEKIEPGEDKRQCGNCW